MTAHENNMDSGRRIRVLIAEDHELTRFGVRFALEKYPILLLTGEATNGAEVVRHVELNPPDVILMDIGMPEMDGIEATKRVKALHPSIKIVMLTSKNEDQLVYSALSAGADAYCMKDIKPDRLVQIIQMALDGVVWLDPAIARIVIQGLPQDTASPGNSGRVMPPVLSVRELALLKCIAANQSLEEIAKTMTTSAGQVNLEVLDVLKKLAVDAFGGGLTQADPVAFDPTTPNTLVLSQPEPSRTNIQTASMDKSLDTSLNIMPINGANGQLTPGWALDESIGALDQGKDYRNKLIPREVEILRLLVENKSVWEISNMFQISPEWVNAHISNIMNKMGVNTPELAAAQARQDKLFQQKIFS